MAKKVTDKLNHILLSVVGFVAILCIWYLAVRFTTVGAVIPTPLEVFRRLIESFIITIGANYTLLGHLAISLRRVLTGFALAAAAGVLLGVGMGRFQYIEAIVKPLFELVRPIPGVAWIPLAIVWFGVGETAKIFIIFIGGFVNIVVNVYAGARRVDQNIMNVAYMLGANNVQVFFKVVIPSCVPYIFSGLQVGLSTCWMAVLAAEMVAATSGVGWIITAGQENGDMAQIFVGIIVIAITGLILAVLMRVLEARLCRWKVRGS